MTITGSFHYDPPLTPCLDILYQDEDLLVLNKPAGLLSVPGRAADHKDSLQFRAREKFPHAKTVHRLDMDTSGLMVMGLNDQAHRHLSRQFETRQVTKEYIALVEGYPNTDHGEVSLPLICDWPNRPLQKVDHDHGKPARTIWKVLERHSHQNTARLLLTPVTGRSHQLRVHMAETGHPIRGDRFYGTDNSRDISPRLMLHAEKLAFTHPRTNQAITFHCPCPF